MNRTLITILFLVFTTINLQAQLDNSQEKNLPEKKITKTHYDSRRLRKKTYSSLYWFILSSVLYYKSQQNCSWLAPFFGIFALDNGINMVHYYHESLCTAHQEDSAFNIIKDYIMSFNKSPETFIIVVS